MDRYLMKGEESEIRTKSCYGLPLSLDEEQERRLVCITDTMCQPYLGADKSDSFPRDRQWVRKTKGTTCAQKITSRWDTNPWTTVMNRRHEVFLTVPRDYALLCKNNDSTLGKSAG